MKLIKEILDNRRSALSVLLAAGAYVIGTALWAAALVKSLGILGVWSFGPEDFTGDTVFAILVLHFYAMIVLLWLKWIFKN